MASAEDHPVHRPLARLVDAWCERRDLRSLAAVLPAYTSNNGLTDGWADLMEALRSLGAGGHLPAQEQAEIARLVVLVERIVYRT